MHVIDIGMTLAAVVTQYPPHIFFGYTISEWLGIVTIIGMLGSFLALVFNRFVVKPITGSVDRLSDEFKDFRKSSHEEHESFHNILDDHEDRIINLERNDAVQDRVLDELTPHQTKENS